MNLTDESEAALSSGQSLGKLKTPKKIIKLDKTSVVLSHHQPAHFISKTSSLQSTAVVKSAATNSPANNITNTIFSSNQGTGPKPILVLKKISELTAGFGAKPAKSPVPAVRKPKIKNSGHIKTLLSQSEQHASHKHHSSLLNENSFAFSITKKAPPIKILKQTPPQPAHFAFTAQASEPLQLAPGHVELSVQEVTVETENDPDLLCNYVESEVVVKSEVLPDSASSSQSTDISKQALD